MTHSHSTQPVPEETVLIKKSAIQKRNFAGNMAPKKEGKPEQAKLKTGRCQPAG